MTALSFNMAQAPTPVIVTRRYRTPLTVALLLVLALAFSIWGLFSPFPINFLLWFFAAVALVLLAILLLRGRQRLPKIEASAVLRLIVCQSCGAESEGPFQKGDYVFRTVGKCPRCKGTLYIKALYSPGEKPRVREHRAPAKPSGDVTR